MLYASLSAESKQIKDVFLTGQLPQRVIIKRGWGKYAECGMKAAFETKPLLVL